MKETWKDVVGYEGLYQVSDLGRVRRNGRELSQSRNEHGYSRVSLCKNGKPKTLYVHRLVAEAFVPNPLGLPEINHKDENPSSNAASNLEWCTSGYNKNYGGRAKKFGVSRGKPVICIETGAVYHGVREAMRQTGVHASDISACCSGHRNKRSAGGYHWEYWNG